MPDPLRVAYTLEQCWHTVPGGSAVAALEVHRRLRGGEAAEAVDVIAVAGRHRSAPVPEYRPDGPVRSLAVGRPWLYELWNRFEWPRVEAATGPIDVCHSTVAIPAATTGPHVVTVHDVAFVHAPERFSRHGVRVMRRGLERCRSVDLVMCPSAATAADLIALGFDRGRLRVVPWGVTTVLVGPDALERVRAAYRLPSSFALFVGTIEPRKNLHGLAAAMRSVGDLPLVVAGADGWGDARPDSDGDVRFLGFVPADDLRPLLQAATVFTYPSFEEGFGLPILEAMAQGTPVVTSVGSATEEVAGDAAVLCDPHRPESIANVFDDVLADRERWAAAGRRRAGELTWEATVAATVAVYREAAG